MQERKQLPSLVVCADTERRSDHPHRAYYNRRLPRPVHSPTDSDINRLRSYTPSDTIRILVNSGYFAVVDSKRGLCFFDPVKNRVRRVFDISELAADISNEDS